MKLYHNDHIQAVQAFTVTHNDKKGLSKLMTKGHLGGPQFVGLLADFQMFGSVLSEEIIYQWTACQIKVGCFTYLSMENLCSSFYNLLDVWKFVFFVLLFI